MSSLPSLTPYKLTRILIKHGFILDRSRGSHQVWLNKETKKRVIVPMHNKDLPKGTLAAILKQAGLENKQL